MTTENPLPTNDQPSEEEVLHIAQLEAACQAQYERAQGLTPERAADWWILDGGSFRPLTAAEQAELAAAFALPAPEQDSPHAALILQATEDGEAAAFAAYPLSSSRALLDAEQEAQEALQQFQGTLADQHQPPLDAQEQQVYLHAFQAAYLAEAQDDLAEADDVDVLPPDLRGLFSDEDPSGLEPFDYATDR